ncbi:MAG: hypothetical protein ACLFUS_06295 [Candidatus Sumerlaeia bacterium]
MAKEDQNIIIAWMGWRLSAPKDWRPLRMEGDWMRGMMMMGDGEQAIMQLKWWRPSGRFRWEKWLRRRLKPLGSPKEDAENAPAPEEGFDEIAWIPPRDGVRAFWYGWSAQAEMVIEVVLNASINARINWLVQSKVLPSIRLDGPGDRVHWSVYSSSFISPPGYRLIERRLQLGEAALWLEDASGSRLLLRQVYPAELALKRRDMEKWLKMNCFKEKRKYRARESARPWELDAGGRHWSGWKERGRKRLPLPLGFIRPCETLSAVVRDKELDRLLMVQYDKHREVEEEMLVRMISEMNWAMQDKRETA